MLQGIRGVYLGGVFIANPKDGENRKEYFVAARLKQCSRGALDKFIVIQGFQAAIATGQAGHILDTLLAQIDTEYKLDKVPAVTLLCHPGDIGRWGFQDLIFFPLAQCRI